MIINHFNSGLMNIGNTCFMNSVIQILCNTPCFNDYLQNELYAYEINLVNPLGTQGQIISSFAQLIREMKKDINNSVSIEHFKETFSQFYNNYDGNNQHDAAEFMLQLLDAINEDVNQIQKKPYITMPNSNGREDLVVALESWDVYSQRNQSIITQIFQAQFKNKLECPQCKNISITFDPYMMVQLPLNCKRFQKDFVFYLLDEKQKQKMIDIQIQKHSHIEDIKQYIRDLIKYQDVIFDWCDKFNTYELTNDINQSELKNHKLLVRPMTQFEISIPPNMRTSILITHVNPQMEVLTEIITMIFDFRTKIFEIYDFIERTYAEQFQIHFQVYLKSNSQDTNQQCYFCHKSFCKYCRLQKSQHSLKYYHNLISQPNQQLNIIIMWFEQGIPINFIEETQQEQDYVKQLTIYDLLNQSQLQQQLDDDNSWYCKQCKLHVQAIKQLQLYSVPYILIFHLKRFKQTNHIKTKNNVFVKFPQILNITKYVINLKLPNEYLNNQDLKELKFRLFGIINHFGDMEGGHYNAYVNNNQKWYCCDDSYITEISPSNIITENAYMLFYERIN